MSAGTSLAELTEIIARFQHLLGGFWILVWLIAWVTGVAVVVIGLTAAAKRAEQGPSGGSWAGPVALLVTGFSLLAFPLVLDSLTATLIPGQWDHVGPAIFSTAPNLLAVFDGSATQETIVGIFRIIQFIGGLAVFRGILMLNAAAQPGQRATVGAGLTHIIGGALALNIGPVLAMIDSLVAA